MRLSLFTLSAIAAVSNGAHLRQISDDYQVDPISDMLAQLETTTDYEESLLLTSQIYSDENVPYLNDLMAA